MRKREPRTNVVFDARIRVESSWMNASIRNVSRRGAMVAMPSPPLAGRYVELRRGSVVIIARVVWSDGQHCGLRSQRDISLESLCKPPREYEPWSGSAMTERRAKPRSNPAPAVHIDARVLGRLLEYAAAMAFAVVIAIVLGKMAFDVLAPTAAAVSQAMDHCSAPNGCVS